MPRLQVFQSIWAMEQRRPDKVEWSLEDKIARVADAGYDGLDVYVERTEVTRRAAELLAKRGLGVSLSGFPKCLDDVRQGIALFHEIGAVHYNVIGQIYPLTVDEGARELRRWIEACDEARVPVLVETHRDCITTDLLYTLQLMDALPEMRICADLSHYLVAREFSWPVSVENHAQVRRVLERADAFQGRVASREQIQVQTSFPQHREWFELFQRWWEEGFRLWRARHGADDTLNFLCELGPKEYAMTGPDGYELSDRWEEALSIRDAVQRIWTALGVEEAGAGRAT